MTPLRREHPGVHQIERDFASWSEFVRCAADESLRGWPGSVSARDQSSCGSHYASDRDWYATRDFPEAVHMATLVGWPEGRELLRDSYTLIAPRPEVYKSISLDVAGAIPLAPLFAAGDPAHMMDFGEDVHAARPIVRIDYHSAVLSSVPAKSIMLRGAAVLSLAQDLEARGYSTELRIISGAQGGQWIIRVSVVFKAAGEVLDLDRAAFAIAHPSVQRRFIFAIREQHAELYRTFHGSYGTSLQEPNDPTSGLPGGAIFIPGANVSETPDSARKAVSDAAAELLTERESADD